MDGIHDMGGMDGFGKVGAEVGDSVFHAPWEGRMYALQRAMTFAGAWTIDMSRYTQECLAPGVYLTATYYERWALGMEENVLQCGFVDSAELAAGHALTPGKALRRKLTPSLMAQTPSSATTEPPTGGSPEFRPGDMVRTRNLHPLTHTRLPGYARGHNGIVVCARGYQAFADAAARGDETAREWLYTVSFDARELWGEDADASLSVSIDAFEPYLERAKT